MISDIEKNKGWEIIIEENKINNKQYFPTVLCGKIIRNDSVISLAKYQTPNNRTPPPRAIKLKPTSTKPTYSKMCLTQFSIDFNYIENDSISRKEIHNRKTSMELEIQGLNINLVIRTSLKSFYDNKKNKNYTLQSIILLQANKEFPSSLAYSNNIMQNSNTSFFKDKWNKSKCTSLISVYRKFTQKFSEQELTLKKKTYRDISENDYIVIVPKAFQQLMESHFSKRVLSSQETISLLKDSPLYEDFVFFMTQNEQKIIHTFKINLPAVKIIIKENDYILHESIWDEPESSDPKKIYIRPNGLNSILNIYVTVLCEFVSYFIDRFERRVIPAFNMPCRIFINNYRRKLSSFSHPSSGGEIEVIESKTDDYGNATLSFQCKNRLVKILELGDSSFKAKIFIRKGTNRDDNDLIDINKNWERSSIFHILDRIDDQTKYDISLFDVIVKDLCLVCYEDMNSAYNSDYDMLHWCSNQDSKINPHSHEWLTANSDQWQLKLSQWIIQSILNYSAVSSEEHLTKELYGLLHTIRKNEVKQVLLSDFNYDTEIDIEEYEEEKDTEGWGMWIMLGFIKSLLISSSSSTYPEKLSKKLFNKLKTNPDPTCLIRRRKEEIIEGMGTKIYISPQFSIYWHRMTAIFALSICISKTKDRKTIRTIIALMFYQVKTLYEEISEAFLNRDINLQIKDFVPCIAALRIVLKQPLMQNYHDEVINMLIKTLSYVLSKVEEEKSDRDLESLCFLEAVCVNHNLISLCEVLFSYDPIDAPLTIDEMRT